MHSEDRFLEYNVPKILSISFPVSSSYGMLSRRCFFQTRCMRPRDVRLVDRRVGSARDQCRRDHSQGLKWVGMPFRGPPFLLYGVLRPQRPEK